MGGDEVRAQMSRHPSTNVNVLFPHYASVPCKHANGNELSTAESKKPGNMFYSYLSIMHLNLLYAANQEA